VVAEVALTFVLAVAGVLLARTFERLARVDLGFSPEGVVSLRINLPLGALSRDAQRLFYEDVLERVRRLPGIESAGYSSRLPLSAGRASVETTRADRPGPEVRAIMQAASVGYLPTIGARLIGGRDFSPSDPVASPVVIVNDVLARQLYPEGDAAGRRIRFSLFGRPTDGTVIGVTRALRYNGLTAAASPELYMDYRVRPLMMLLVARTTMPLAESVPLLRSAIRQADASGRITVDQITSLDREIVKQLARPRFYLAMVGAFGLTALALATAGVYGVMSFAVAARRHDLGVRLALGASPTQIFQHTLRSGAVLTGLGLLMGGAGAFAGVTAIRSLLFGVQPRDPATFAAAAALVGAVAIGGCWIPARRARQTDPLAVVRAD
jgi:predicted permease